MRTIYIFALVFFGFSLNIKDVCASDHEWICEEGGRCYTPDTIRCLKNGKVSAWVKDIFSKKLADEYAKKFGKEFKEVKYTLSLHFVDCDNRRFALKSSAFYREDGSVIDSYEMPYLVWKVVIPDSVGEDSLNTLCGVCYPDKE